MTEEQNLCEHSDFTDEGICLVCGIDIGSEEFINSLPELPEGMGAIPEDNLMGIIQLAQATAEEILSYRDPHNPALNKISWAGAQLVRIPDAAVWKEVLPPSYAIAKTLGYRGTYERWVEVCKDYLAER